MIVSPSGAIFKGRYKHLTFFAPTMKEVFGKFCDHMQAHPEDLQGK